MILSIDIFKSAIFSIGYGLKISIAFQQIDSIEVVWKSLLEQKREVQFPVQCLNKPLEVAGRMDNVSTKEKVIINEKVENKEKIKSEVKVERRSTGMPIELISDDDSDDEDRPSHRSGVDHRR